MIQREHAFQRVVVTYLRLALPETALMSGIDHATGSAAEGQRKKTRGIIRGLPDVAIWWAGQFYGLELKAGSNTPSDEQNAVGAKLRLNGFQWGSFRTVEGIETWLRDLGVPLRATTMTAAQRDAALAAKAAAPAKPKRTARKRREPMSAAQRRFGEAFARLLPR